MTEPRPLPYEPAEIRRRLQQRAGELIEKLGFRERPDRAGRIWPVNPMRKDHSKGSFFICVSGDAAGAWKDYATGDKGDIFDLIREMKKLAAWIDAYWWALRFLNLERGAVRSASQEALDRKRAERDRHAAEAKRQADEAGKSAGLFRWWLTLGPIKGTVAETYLVEARGIALARLRHPPGALRFTPALDHIDLATGEVTRWPCLVAAMTRGTKMAAVHRTWLAWDGSGKAPVARPKMMKGPSRGAAIRLSTGPSGLSPTAALAKGRREPLIIGEGIETTLSAAIARPDYRAWAAGSLDHMAALDWPECASAAILLQDAMAPGSPAAQAFARVEAHWRAGAAGRPVKVVASAVGGDFNDWIKAA